MKDPYTPEVLAGSESAAKAVWGDVTRMLTRGGARDQTLPVEILRKSNGSPRRPRSIEFYPGEFHYEPDPAISSKNKTGFIIWACVKQRWSAEQIDHELSKPQNAGGLYYRWRCATDADGGVAFLSYCVCGSYGSGSPYTVAPASRIGGKSIKPSTSSGLWRTSERGVPLSIRNCKALVEFIAQEPRSMTEAVERGPVRKQVSRTYVGDLLKYGVLERTEQQVQTSKGKRTARVLSLALSAPSDPQDALVWQHGRDVRDFCTEQVSEETDDELWERLGLPDFFDEAEPMTLAQMAEYLSIRIVGA